MNKEKPKNPLNEITLNRLKSTEKLLDNWNLLQKYVKPLEDSSQEIKRLMKEIRHQLTMAPIEDLILVTVLGAERQAYMLCMPKLFCLSCQKELEKEEDNNTKKTLREVQTLKDELDKRGKKNEIRI